MRKWAIALACCGLAALLSSCNKKQEKGKRTIAVIPKATTHIFWQSVRQGAEDAGRDLGVKTFWNGPERESDRERQIQIIEDFIVQKVSAVVLAPLDGKALVPSIEKLAERNIPCVIIDSGAETDRYVTYAATDNYKGGAIGARRMGEILNGRGKVIVVKYIPNSVSTDRRVAGFMDTIKKEFPNIRIVDHKFAGDTVDLALTATEDLLIKNAEVDGLFACNASTAVGALQGLKRQNRLDKIKMVGFDAEKALLDGLKAGEIDALVVQNPYRMGYEGVKAAIAALDGKTVPKRIDTGVELVTLKNVNDAKIKVLLGTQ